MVHAPAPVIKVFRDARINFTFLKICCLAVQRNQRLIARLCKPSPVERISRPKTDLGGGEENAGIRMMLTSQVFAVESGVAAPEQTAQIIRAADALLYRENAGGYCLNTDFNEVKDGGYRTFPLIPSSDTSSLRPSGNGTCPCPGH